MVLKKILLICWTLAMNRSTGDKEIRRYGLEESSPDLLDSCYEPFYRRQGD